METLIASRIQIFYLIRLRPTNIFEEWINRCEETINSFLTATKIDSALVQKIVDNEQTEHWRDILIIETNTENEALNTEHKKPPKENSLTKKNRERKEKNERKMTGLVMGKLHEDMMFLDKLANHPALQKNLLTFEIDMKEKRDIENSLKGIRGTALDGLNFLQVRKSFWETSLPPIVKNKNTKNQRISRSNEGTRETTS